jgi:membrane-associated phospholipid phosphatase
MLDYVFTLPFYVLLPVNERWFYPESNAMMLSDKIDTALIDFIRPMSGLDNCFPSSHTSLTVVAVLMCFVLKLPLRFSALALGATVLISTFFLGVHWVADVLAGVAMGVIAVTAALRLDEYLRRVWTSSELELQT